MNIEQICNLFHKVLVLVRKNEIICINFPEFDVNFETCLFFALPVKTHLK